MALVSITALLLLAGLAAGMLGRRRALLLSVLEGRG